jgi:aspartyl-tRNA(Asn)/glutamyl-tRNA(Gln) amidotransferase subunit A
LSAAPEGIFLARPAEPGEGTTLAVKDLFDTAGLTTTYGSILFADHVPDETAEAVLRLERGGYVDIGKTNLHEFAYGVTSENPHFGIVPNPVAPGRIAGGSSGGSAAAVAAGLAEVALGTDSGGSIRIPAACCGIVGFKPTFGLVPLDGCFPLAPSFDHAGPMTASVEDSATMLEALVPGFERSAAAALGDLSVGVAWLDEADPLVRARVSEAAALFPGLCDADFPGGDSYDTTAVFTHEAAETHRELYAEHPDSYGADVRARLDRGLAVTDGEVRSGSAAREAYRERCLEALEGLDLLLTPTLPCVAPPLGTRELAGRTVVDVLTRFTRPFNVIGWPVLALPCGPAEDGLPASLQLAGRPGADALVLAAGAALESALAASGLP